MPIGKKSFGERELVENYAALIDEIVRAKPAASKGRYIRGITLASTMGPGIKVDPARTRGIVDDLEEQARDRQRVTTPVARDSWQSPRTRRQKTSRGGLRGFVPSPPSPPACGLDSFRGGE